MNIPLELLAPAGDARIGMAAVDHGADAVYIGAPRFSARSRAGNAVDAIAELIRYAHLFHCRVYVALNTILTDAEIPLAREIIHQVYEVGADGVIVQDMGLLELDLPPIALIASTQMHNTTPEKVKFLEAVGFQRVILARELGLDEIAAIRAHTSVELEAFVHGALCVSFSGQCYMSQFAMQRSANRGDCAQPCRHSYRLLDGNGDVLVDARYLLSLKDMNRMAGIADLVAAGVTSFKIEGRYKEIDYVKNITAAYRLAIDRFIATHPGYRRAGSGSCRFEFQPDPDRTFNRGYTNYFLTRNREKAGAMDTPKSMGQYIGRITGIGRDFFQVPGGDLHPGDGLCFITEKKVLAGCRVDRVVEGRVYPNAMAELKIGTGLYRNFDHDFSRALQQSTHCRKIEVEMVFRQDDHGIGLEVTDEDGHTAAFWQDRPFEPARDPQRAAANIEIQLARTGDTPYRVISVEVQPRPPGFLPLSVLNESRRRALDMLTRARVDGYPRLGVKIHPNTFPYPLKELDYRANILNKFALNFYSRHGARVREPAFESTPDDGGADRCAKAVMVTRHCLRQELDACLKDCASDWARSIQPPLRIADRQHVYRLEFDCNACRMRVIPES